MLLRSESSSLNSQHHKIISTLELLSQVKQALLLINITSIKIWSMPQGDPILIQVWTKKFTPKRYVLETDMELVLTVQALELEAEWLR